MQRARITIKEAVQLCMVAFQKAGYSPTEAQAITDHLVDAECRGHPFAGLPRALSILEHLREAGIEAKDKTEITREGPAYAQVDGHNSVGYHTVKKATELAILKAKTTGVAVVGASGHWYSGNLAYYAEMCTRNDLVVMIAANASAVVAPYGGYEPRFSTNPICMGFPTSQRDRPVIWDIGTSKAMYSQVKLAQRLGVALPEDTAYDVLGRPTRDPWSALQGAMSVWGGYKGSGLAIMIQLLGVAAGAKAVTPPLADFGLLIMAFDPGVMQPIQNVKTQADEYGNWVRETKTLPGFGPVQMPFDGSSERRNQIRAQGWFESDRQIVDELRSWGS